MNIIRYIPFLIILFATLSCTSRNDRVFSAFDELHYIILYESDNDFEILYNGMNTAPGNYSLRGDTIFLKYDENQFKEFNPNEKLTRIVLIDKGSMRVKSIDGNMPFCANIELDSRNK